MVVPGDDGGRGWCARAGDAREVYGTPARSRSPSGRIASGRIRRDLHRLVLPHEGGGGSTIRRAGERIPRETAARPSPLQYGRAMARTGRAVVARELNKPVVVEEVTFEAPRRG